MSSQFEELFKARSEAAPSTPKKKIGKQKKEPDNPPPVTEVAATATVAKSKNSEFEQALIYLKKHTKKEVKKVLLDDPSGRNFSDLVEELLSLWLETQK